LINRVDNQRDRELLTRWFIDFEPQEEEDLATLSPVGRSSYEFLENRDPVAVEALVRRLPQKAIDDLEELSPRNSIHRVRAELFIIHDRGDPYIPYTESRRMRDDIAGRPDTHFDELRIFEHVEPTLSQRPDIIIFDSTKLLYRLYQLLLRWD
jgi:hypothetical protein